ncbi:hypothetical protein D3C85_1377450 [compost metagenome]
MNTGWLRIADWRTSDAGMRLWIEAASTAKSGSDLPSASRLHRVSMSAWVVVSSRDRPRRWSSTTRRLMRWARALSCRAAVCAPVARVRVSKKLSCSTFRPSAPRPLARIAVR